jgi:hypothetical protein
MTSGMLEKITEINLIKCRANIYGYSHQYKFIIEDEMETASFFIDKDCVQ